MDKIDSTANIRALKADLDQGTRQAGQVGNSGSQAPRADSSRAGSSPDTVDITKTATQMLKLEQDLAGVPDVDSERVAAIKVAIADQSYQVDADKIADRLLQLESGGRQK